MASAFDSSYIMMSKKKKKIGYCYHFDEQHHLIFATQLTLNKNRRCTNISPPSLATQYNKKKSRYMYNKEIKAQTQLYLHLMIRYNEGTLFEGLDHRFFLLTSDKHMDPSAKPNPYQAKGL